MKNWGIPYLPYVFRQTGLSKEGRPRLYAIEGDISSGSTLSDLRVQPLLGRQHSFVQSDHKIVSKASFSLPLIQEEQLSISKERMCTILVNCLED